jgi:NAD-dependent deacetylase
MEQSSDNNQLQKAACMIKESVKVVALTGAGSSTPSGIPDFRSEESGLWNRFSPMQVASLSAFHRNPEKFFIWLRPIVHQMLNADPNPAHWALAQLEENHFIDTVITQNFDGLHQKAGSKNVLQVHGTLNTLTCIHCYQQVESSQYQCSYLEKGIIPKCDTCGSILKPDVILFEEQLPSHIWIKAREAATSSDCMIILGTSLVVSPVAELPQYAKENGAKIIIINKTKTYMDGFADVVFHQNVEETLPHITRILLND